MAKMDIYNNLSPIINFPIDAYTANIVPVGTDLQGYEGAMVIITTGVITDGTWTVHIEENDVATAGDGGWADVAATDLLGTIPGPFTNVGNAFDNQLYKIGYIGSKRFIRVHIVETVMGTAEIAAIIERGVPHSAPTPVDTN
jgi:hypothetical protein